MRKSLVSFLGETFSDRYARGTLYHYTSAQTFPVFFNDKADLYCTYYASLNDDLEIAEGWKVAIQYLENVFDLKPNKKNLLLKEYHQTLHDEISTPWIMSFSEEGDSLPQWVAYTDRSCGGYAIGFDKALLRYAIDDVAIKQRGLGESRTCSVYFAPCFYEPGDIRKILDFFFQEQHAELIKAFSCKTKPTRLDVIRVASKIFLVAGLIKHRSFRSEQEWRIIYSPCGHAYEECEFIAGKPRQKVNAFSQKKRLRDIISEVRISPHGDVRTLAVNAAIMRKKFRLNFEIINSDSPFNGK